MACLEAQEGRGASSPDARSNRGLRGEQVQGNQNTATRVRETLPCGRLRSSARRRETKTARWLCQREISPKAASAWWGASAQVRAPIPQGGLVGRGKAELKGSWEATPRHSRADRLSVPGGTLNLRPRVWKYIFGEGWVLSTSSRPLMDTQCHHRGLGPSAVHSSSCLPSFPSCLLSLPRSSSSHRSSGRTLGSHCSAGTQHS